MYGNFGGIAGLMGGLFCPESISVKKSTANQAAAQSNITHKQIELYNLLASLSHGFQPGASSPAPKPRSPWAAVDDHDANLNQMMKDFDAPPSYIEKHKAEMELYQ